MKSYFVVTETYFEYNICMVTEDFDKAKDRFMRSKEPCHIAEWREDVLIAEYTIKDGILAKEIIC